MTGPTDPDDRPPDTDDGSPDHDPDWRPDTAEAWGEEDEAREAWRPEDPAAWERAMKAARETETDEPPSSRRPRLRRSSYHREKVRRSAARGVAPGSWARRSWRKSRHRGLKLSLLGLFLLVAAFAAIMADAYFQSVRVYQDVRAVLPSLTTARNYLARGQLPPEDARGDAFTLASQAVDRAEARVDGARFTFRLAGAIPLFNRPIKAVTHGLAAAREESDAATLMRDLVVDTLGDAAVVGPGRFGQASNTPIFKDGVADVKLIQSLTPRLEAVLRHLQAADAEVRAIPDIPFLSRAKDLRTDALAQSTAAIKLAKEALSGVQFLPSFLGADGPRTYFLALENNAELRANGGAVLAYAFVRIDEGKLSLEGKGAIHEIDDKVTGFTGATLPDSVAWYLKHAPQPPPLVPRIPDTSLTPDFPAVAQAWASILKEAADQKVDGVIALDPYAVSYIMGRKTIRIPSYPDAITSENLVRITEKDQYSLKYAQQKAFPGDLIESAWTLLKNPTPFVRTAKQMGIAFKESHLQIWVDDPDTQAQLARLGWDGGVRPGSGDYLFPVENLLRGSKVAYFTHSNVEYDVTVLPTGAITSTAVITLDNRTPPGLPNVMVTHGDRGYGLNTSLIGMYVPAAATLTEDLPAGAPPVHQEAGAKVLLGVKTVNAGGQGSVRFAYMVPDVIQVTPGGRLYQLTIQRQAMVNPATVTVNVTFPQGSVPRVPDGWTVKDNVATYTTTLTTDIVAQLFF